MVVRRNRVGYYRVVGLREFGTGTSGMGVSFEIKVFEVNQGVFAVRERMALRKRVRQGGEEQKRGWESNRRIRRTFGKN